MTKPNLIERHRAKALAWSFEYGDFALAYNTGFDLYIQPLTFSGRCECCGKLRMSFSKDENHLSVFMKLKLVIIRPKIPKKHSDKTRSGFA